MTAESHTRWRSGSPGRDTAGGHREGRRDIPDTPRSRRTTWGARNVLGPILGPKAPPRAPCSGDFRMTFALVTPCFRHGAPGGIRTPNLLIRSLPTRQAGVSGADPARHQPTPSAQPKYHCPKGTRRLSHPDGRGRFQSPGPMVPTGLGAVCEPGPASRHEARPLSGPTALRVLTRGAGGGAIAASPRR